jgi:hypothetical protein
MACTEELSEVSTLSAVIVKWKRLGATMAQPLSGKPHKLTERDRRVLKHVKILSSVATFTIEFKLPLEAMSAQELLVSSFMTWVPMAVQPHTNLGSPCTMQSIGWSVVKLADIGLWSSEGMNHASPSVNPTV